MSEPTTLAQVPSEPKKPLWNSLEVAKLAVASLTSLAICLFTLSHTYEQDARNIKDRENERERQSLEKKSSEEHERYSQVLRYRVELWKTLSPWMNDLYCYFLYVGHWKELDPVKVIKIKRDLDHYIYSNAPFFSPQFLAKYNEFMKAAFATGNGWGVDAKIRSPAIRLSDRGMETMFALGPDGNGIDNTQAIHTAYFAWLEFAGEELSLKTFTPPKPRTPSAEEIAQHSMAKK